MKILLIYQSKTGFTERYANWIGEEIDCRIEKISNIQNIDFKYYDLVIYGSRIHAGRIDGLDKIRKLNLKNKLILFVTGATPKETEAIEEVWNNHLSETELQSIKHFYLPAGLNYERMGFLDKVMMKIASIILNKKTNKSVADIDMQKIIKQSYDISDKINIRPLITYIKSLQ